MGAAAGEPLASRSLFLESEMRMPWGARELTGTSNFTRHVSVYDNIVGHLSKGELMWRGQLKPQVGTMGTGDTANISPLIPNLTPSYLVVTSPKTIIFQGPAQIPPPP